MEVPNIFSTITATLSPLLTHNDVFQFTCIEQIVPGKSQAYWTLQNCQSSVQNLLPVTLLIPKIRRWLLILAMASMTQSHSTFLQSNNLLSKLVTEHKNVSASYYFLDAVFYYLYECWGYTWD